MHIRSGTHSRPDRRPGRRPRALLRRALCGVVALMGIAMTGPAASAAAPPAPPSPRAIAASSATALVAGRPAFLHAGAEDVFVQHPVLSSSGLQYVPYDRTYRNLPVIGGDFVLVLDGAGRMLSSSVAQRQTIAGLSVTPAITSGQAEQVAGGQLSSVSRVNGSRLVVDVLHGAPRLAWESVVEGTTASGFNRLSVYVDAASGAVLGTRAHLSDGTGTAAYNGPNPVSIATTATATGFSMTDPTVSGLSCQDLATGSVMTNSVDTWGTGDAANRQTACVDAMFAAQTENRMLTQWLGRNSFDGQGGAWPIKIGLNDTNAFYDPDSPQVQIGHNQVGQWIPAMDVLGHEMGHGIDAHTPGGLSNDSTKEFVADAFGAATEWFATEPAPFDTPDYTVGEQVNLVGTGPIRYMYEPDLVGMPDCYSPSVDGMETHAASGPGDHWLYLLAEGAHPTDGQPQSSVCSALPGPAIGLQAAITILYNAMLMKTSASSYGNYRLWTLTAAKNLFPSSCFVYYAVRSAWNAINVPNQPGEPFCGLIADDPGPQTSAVGRQVSLTLTASNAPGPYFWTITGLPPGLSSDSAGNIFGRPTTTGTYTVSAEVDAQGFLGSLEFFTWTINLSVPSIVGLTRASAGSVLSGVGLALGSEHDKVDCERAGTIIGQSPRSGTIVAPGTAVNFTFAVRPSGTSECP